MPDTQTHEASIAAMMEDFAKDVKFLFGNSVARRKNLARARKQVQYLFRQKLKEAGKQ